MIEILKPLFKGELEPFGNTLHYCEELHKKSLLLKTLLDFPEQLEALLIRYSVYLNCSDKHVVTSAWTLDYLRALIPPIIASHCMLHHCFPVGADTIGLMVNQEGKPVGFSLAHLGKTFKDTHPFVRYKVLLDDHLLPLIRMLSKYSNLAPRVMWGNVSRYITYVFDYAFESGQYLAEKKEDREFLLYHNKYPDGRNNPLFGQIRICRKLVNGRFVSSKAYKNCCLCYRLPDQDFCQACPHINRSTACFLKPLENSLNQYSKL